MRVHGSVRVPGDKSITHRALLFGALAKGRSHVGGALTSLDARSSARVLRQLGVGISALRAGSVIEIQGRGRLRRAEGILDCGNSGTTTRLLLGMLAGHRFAATLTGDRSLRRRPMRRVTVPLSQMGARFSEMHDDGLPLTIKGGSLRAIRYEQPVSSAQIKSCLLLAGVTGSVEVAIREPFGRSRDHTERLLRAFGYRVDDAADGWIEMSPTGRIEPFDLQVPGDPSSAAFLAGAALIAEGGELRITGVGINPTRIGFLAVLQRMGATPRIESVTTEFDEPVGDLVVAPGSLRGTDVSAGEIPGLIDEIPLLAVVASRAAGTTVFHDVGELRVKESDRLGLMATNLRAVGVQAEVQGDDLHVSGSDQVPSGRVRTEGDHRLAMAFAVLGTVPGARIAIDDMRCADVSFPRFRETLASIRVRGT